MSKLRRFVPIAILVAILVGLFGIIPAQAAAGTVSWIKAGSIASPVSQAWINVGGNADVLVVDTDYAAGGPNDTGPADTINVKITSTSDSTGFTKTVTEVAGNAGKFVININTGGATNAGTNTIQAVDGDVVTASYFDVADNITKAAQITVENTGPTITNLTPAHNTVTKAGTIAFSAEITDTQSGVDASTIQFVFTGGIVITVPPDSTSDITNGKRAVVTLGVPQATITWRVEAKDNAGTLTKSDAEATAGQQDHKLIVDQTAPTLASATTGQIYDPTTGSVHATKTDRSVVRVQFTEAQDRLAAGTIERADFLVNGVQPTSVAYYGDDTLADATIKQSVFLTLSSPLASNATPRVQYVGAISDRAGNTAATGEIAAAVDGIPPGITVTIDKQLSKDTVVLTIVTDEPVQAGSTPVVDPRPRSGLAFNPAPFNSTATSTPNTFTATITIAAGNDSGYDVEVTAIDRSSLNNTSTVKANDWTAVPTPAPLFEIDTALAAPTAITPVNLATVQQRDPFYIQVDWSSETGEYTGDTHKKVTLSSTTLDGNAVTFATEDNIKFVAAITGPISLGQHTVKFTGTDEVGNTNTQTVTFTVQERAPFKRSLLPGWNLMSLIGNPPANKNSVKDVFGSASVSTVVTYDANAVAGPWLIAQKGADGNWTGTLTTIDAQHAYWVNATAVTTVSVLLPERQYDAVPPTIPLAVGWNLVPVVDVTVAAVYNPGVSVIDADDYFQGTSWTVAYGYNTAAYAWVRINKGLGPGLNNLNYGDGYWVYTTAKGTITP